MLKTTPLECLIPSQLARGRFRRKGKLCRREGVPITNFYTGCGSAYYGLLYTSLLYTQLIMVYYIPYYGLLYTIFDRKSNPFIYLPLKMIPFSHTYSTNTVSHFGWSVQDIFKGSYKHLNDSFPYSLDISILNTYQSPLERSYSVWSVFAHVTSNHKRKFLH